MAKRFRNILGPKIRELRQRAGLSQDDLAARLQLAGLENLDRVAVAKIESQIHL
jgi:transcriptional regulator with XRE-family HTH domain